MLHMYMYVLYIQRCHHHPVSLPPTTQSAKLFHHPVSRLLHHQPTTQSVSQPAAPPPSQPAAPQPNQQSMLSHHPYMIFFWPKWEWNGLFLYTDSGQDHRMMYVHINLVISYCPLPESQSTFRLPSCCQDCSSPFLEESSGEDDVHPQSRLSEYWPHEVWNEWASRNHIEELQQHCTLQKSRWAIA